MPQRAIEPLCIAVLVSGCLFGGSSAPGRILPALPELLCLPLFVCTAVGWTQIKPSTRIPLWIAAVVLCLPALQLVPLPPKVWSLLPGRAPVAQAYSLAGIALPWLPVSLAPTATLAILLGTLPAVSLFLAVPCLAVAARRRLIHVAIALGAVDVMLGLGQLAGGESSPLRFYAGASLTDAVGFFANRNHQALFLAILIPLAGAIFSSGASVIERVWLALAGAILIVGVTASGSRAGLVLGVGACLGAAWILTASRRATSKLGATLAWGLLAIVPLAVGLILFGTVMSRFQLGALSDDLRWQIARTTWQAIWRVFPIGGGFGSFESLYAQLEQPTDLISAIINRAHDDWLEVTLEGGLPALVLLAAALAFLVRETFMGARLSDRSPFPRAIQRATLAILWLCALHSIVDYPLRTMSVNVLVALACGLRAAVSVRSAEVPAVRPVDPKRVRSVPPRRPWDQQRPARRPAT